jgi:uncharacterized protein (TIGR03437 family)
MDRFNNVPSGVQLWVPSVHVWSLTQPGPGAPRTGTAVLINTDENGAGPFARVAPLGTVISDGVDVPVARVALTNGAGSAVWEVTERDAGPAGNLEIPVYFAFTSGGTISTSPPAPSTATVTGGFAPISALSSSAGTLIPRFVDRSPGLDTLGTTFAAATIGACSGLPPTVSFAGPTGSSLPGIQTFYPTALGPPLPLNLLVLTDTQGVSPTFLPQETLQQSQVENQATAGWLTVTPNSTTTPVTATIQVDPTGRVPGNYDGRILVTAPGATNAALSFPVRMTVRPPAPWFPANGVTSAASYVSGAVAPGLVTAIFGHTFGPDALAGLTVTPSGTLSTSAGNTRVLFDGVPAPMLYSVKGTLATIVPYAVAGKATTSIEVEYQGVKSQPVSMPVVDAVPGILTLDQSGGGPGAILNQDFSINTSANPAPVGSVIQIFWVGGGQTTPVGETGKLASVTPKRPVLPVTVTIGGISAGLEYVGTVATLVEGVFQINARVPPGVEPGANVPIVIKVGDKESPPWPTVAIAPARP